MVIHCIGDSHCSFFSGCNKIQPKWPQESEQKIQFFKVYRLGAVLAYNLCKLGTRMKGRENLLSILNNVIPPKSKVLLCFGEIDCRAHILVQASLQRKSYKEVTDICVDRYFSVIKEVQEKGFEVIVWNVIPSAPVNTIGNREYPVYGTCYERNMVTKYFNECLERKLDKEDIHFINIFDHLVSEDGITKQHCLYDTVHLAQNAMPFVFDELAKKFPALANLIF